MDIDFIIDGNPVCADGGGTFERHDPVTSERVTRTAAAGLADVETVAASAAKAFVSWSETGPSARRALLLKAADRWKAAPAISSN
jgi:acyl-CoA reductase-like NAD-dependent aldehyde dehydrogenase